VYLKSVSIQGFKSFPDKINVNFTEGLTAIVGPNGSGKSNICDAIRWVLGEQSTRTLRGTKMEDVIFNGTAKRSATGFAEVTLVLDNREHILSSPYEEIAVTRRYYRSGESEYSINRQAVRLRDIHELFMDTGLGRDGYSIIGQGRIAEILSLRSEDRRQVFEEAAGITKFRYRKTEALRKLQAAEENLQRVGDIITQLEERMGPLQTASTKAEKYLKLRDHLRDRELGLWLYQLDGLRETQTRTREALVISQTTLDLNGQAADRLDEEIQQGYDALQACDVRVEQHRKENAEQENAHTRNQGEIALRESDVENHQEHIRRLEAEIQAAQSTGQQLADQQSDLEEQLVQTRIQRERLERELEEYMSRDDTLGGGLAEKDRQMEQLEQQLKAHMASRADARIALSAANAQLVTGSERMDTIGEELSRREEEVWEQQGLRDKHSTRLQQLTTQCQELQNTLQGYQKRLELRKSELDALLEEYKIRERELYQQTSRQSLLRDMEREFEGYGRSVKTVMQAAGHGRLRGVCGPVSSLLDTQEQYVLAIETALGGSAQHIVVENEAAGKEGIRLLQREKAGRATFLPLTSLQSRPFTWKGVEAQPGYVGIASQLVRCEQRLSIVADNLLGRTVVAEDLDSAVAMARQYRYAFRIVTLDGQVLGVGGSMTGGSAGRSSGVFARSAELQRLEQQVEENSAKLARLKEKGEAARAAHSQAQYDTQRAQEELRQKQEQQVEARYQLQTAQAAWEEQQRQLELLRQESESLQGKAEESRQRAQQLSGEIAGLDQAIGQTEQQMEQLRESREEFIRQRAQLNEHIFNSKIDINTRRKDEELLENQLASLARQQTEGREASSQKAAEITDRQREIEACKAHIEGLRQENTRLEQAMESHRQAIGQETTRRMELQQQITGWQQEEKETRARLTSLEREHARLEHQLEQAEAGQEDILGRMWEQYELTLSEAEELRTPLEDPEGTAREVTRLKNEIKGLGSINVDAIEEYREVSGKYAFLTEQREDLQKSRQGLEVIITDLTRNMRKVFREQFSVINQQFGRTFRELFGGGTAELVLENTEDVLEGGIEIRVQPPGKKVRSLTLLSGGEQAFVAIALIFAILRVRPTPFCVFDEIEAALDDVNVGRFASYLQRSDNRIQFIVVTHRRGTMEAADMLYGVTMQEQGVSKLLAINVAEVERKLHMKAT
jgi:chromosome segregation protein